MMIRVRCMDRSYGFVEDSNLDDLVRRGIVVAFFRPGSDEWVDVENNNIRKKSNIEYSGPERRIKCREESINAMPPLSSALSK